MGIKENGEEIIQLALRYQATDIHFMPEESKTIVQLRIQGKIYNVMEITNQLFVKLVSHFKFLAGMDIGEKRKPQDGSLVVELQNNHPVHIRLSTLPGLGYENLVLRLFPQSDPPSLFNLSLFPQTTIHLNNFIHFSHGLIIVTGPTGSGKTTTLYAMLKEIQKKGDKKIITIEDPIEINQSGIVQIQLNEKAGITYESGLKAILRHDPDVIVVGEIRDIAIAKLAVRAAYTGHLVLTTLHSADTTSAIFRLQEMGIPDIDINQTLKAVISQRLVSIACPFCKGKCSPYCLEKKKITQLAILEVLSGSNIQNIIQDHELKNFKSLKHLFSKAYALGYTSSFNEEEHI